MKTQLFHKCSMAVIALLGCATLAGCFGSSPNPNIPRTQITAETSTGGIEVPWADANISGMALFDEGAYGYQCFPASDTNCVLSFGGPQNPQYTNSSGNYLLTTDAIPAKWQIAVAADSNCPTGGSEAVYLSPNGSTIIYCGTVSSGSATASPAYCTQTVNNATGQITSNCPTTITLTTSTPVLPTGQALDVLNYDNTGTEHSSSSASATSTTTITVPLPTLVGDNVLVITNPSTNQVIGAALFTLNVTVYNPCGNKKSC